MPEEQLKLRTPQEVVVRMYGQGFGDCFLIAFPRVTEGQEADAANPVYVVIDSGVFYRTPGDRKRMSDVAQSIKTATGAKIDLLVATHEHHDHLCGFEYAKDDWKEIEVSRLWLAWTEDEQNPATQRYDREKEALQLQVESALQVASRYQDRDPGLTNSLHLMQAVLGFVGEDAEPADGDGLPPLGDGEIKPPRKLSKLPDRVLDDFAKEPGKRFSPNGAKTECDFCEPGQVRTVPRTAVDAYVLGPPMAEGRLAQDLVEGEVYPESEGDGEANQGNQAQAVAALAQRLELAAASDRAERASIGAALARHLPTSDDAKDLTDSGAPFPRTMSLPYAAARQHPFFCEHYFEGRSEQQIETEWLHGIGRLALQVDRVINNTSLVLAFRLPDGRVLLFVGDAQGGNWLSWHEIRKNNWRRPEGGEVEYRPTAADLLARTVIYKVGHHGSHNATLKTRGLEMMPDGLIAFVPTSRVFPQEQNEWTIPLPTLTDALWRKSGGRVVFPHEHSKYDYTNTAFKQRVESAMESFDPMRQRGEIIEDKVPLWRQVRI